MLQVKGNQPKLQAAIEAFFAEVDATVKVFATKVSSGTTTARSRTTQEKSRGRVETRHFSILPLP